MSFYIAFDKENSIEFILYRKVFEKDGRYFSIENRQCLIRNIGHFLLEFLNTNLEDPTEFKQFIYKYTFEVYCKEFCSVFTSTSPESFKKFTINKHFSEYVLDKTLKEYQNEYIDAKNIFLEYLNLPFKKLSMEEEKELDELISNSNLSDSQRLNIQKIESYMELAMKNLENTIASKRSTVPDSSDKNEKDSAKSKSIAKKNSKDFIDTFSLSFYLVNISLDFNMLVYMHAGIPALYKVAPYAFRTDNLLGILALELKEFTTNPHNTIKICQHCNSYYIPHNLKATKYCKKCRNIGKQSTYKKNLSQNDVLKLYRKRYMSLASSVSHYGTPKSIQRFENYKTEGSIMKEKFLKKEISKKEFKNWIEESKKKS